MSFSFSYTIWSSRRTPGTASNFCTMFTSLLSLIVRSGSAHREWLFNGEIKPFRPHKSKNEYIKVWIFAIYFMLLIKWNKSEFYQANTVQLSLLFRQMSKFCQLNLSQSGCCDVCRLSSSILLINHRYNLDHLVYSLNCFRSVTILNINIKSSI